METVYIKSVIIARAFRLDSKEQRAPYAALECGNPNGTLELT
jgi:hypothetical protein